jgi:hypothetical protein
MITDSFEIKILTWIESDYSELERRLRELQAENKKKKDLKHAVRHDEALKAIRFSIAKYESVLMKYRDEKGA